MRSTQELIDTCRAAGMRVTAQRRAIFEVLVGNGQHPTAEEVFRAARRKARGLSLATVYNTLETLHSLGELGRLRLPGGGPRDATKGTGTTADRFDSETRPHHHFRCERCDRVFDAFGDLPLPQLEGLEGCQVSRVELSLAGRCSACADVAGPTARARTP